MGQNRKAERPVLEEARDDGNSSFARALGSSEYHTREKGLAALTAWLSRRPDVTEFDLLRIWKGVFYAFWHSDKLPVQTALAERLSEIMTLVPNELGALYYQTFMRTMRREWIGIDHLRLDKFMLLLRKFLATLLRMLQGSSWDEVQVAHYAGFWLHEVLCPADTLPAAGVAYHLADILLPELRQLAQDTGQVASSGTLAVLLQPFCQALAAARDPGMVHRLQQGMFMPLVEEVRQPSKGGTLRQLDVQRLAEHLFDLGARKETKVRNREALYGLSTQLEKAAMQQAKRAASEQQTGALGKQQQRKRAAADTEEEDQAAAGRSRKKPTNKRQSAAAEEPAALKPVSAGTRSSGGGPAAVVQVQVAGEGRAAANGDASTKKSKKEAKVAAPSLATAAAMEAAPQQPAQQQAAQRQTQAQAPLQSQQRQSRRQQLAAEAAAGTPAGQGSPSKKNVKFSLKRNLVMTIGQPPLPADVRTPPTSRPKGSALKKTGSLEADGTQSAPGRLNRRGGLRSNASVSRLGNGAGPKSAPKAGRSKQQQQQHGAGPRRLSLKSPAAVPRPRASEFF